MSIKRIIRRALRRTGTLMQSAHAIRRRAEGRLPATLYHYTSADALLSILEKRELWAGNIAHLNDARELKHGIEIVEETIAAERSKAPDSTARDLLRRTAETLADMRNQWAQNFYAVSFCSDGDLLSQWRGYGLMGGGYCLGLNPRHLHPVGADQDDDSVSLRRIFYKKVEQRRLIRDVLRRAFTFLPRRASAQHVKDLAFGLAMELFLYFSSFKDQSFEEEKEWRLVYLSPNRGEVRFRASHNALKPYIVVPLKETRRERTLVSVRHGPTLDSNTAVASLKLRLADSYSKVRVLASDVPYRSV